MSCSFPSPFCPPWHFLIYMFHPAAWPQGRADRLPAHGAALTAAPRRQPEARALRAAAALTCDVLAFSQLQHPSRRGQTTQIPLRVNITIKSLSLEGDNPALQTVNALNSAGVQLLRNAPLPHTERSPPRELPARPAPPSARLRPHRVSATAAEGPLAAFPTALPFCQSSLATNCCRAADPHQSLYKWGRSN